MPIPEIWSKSKIQTEQEKRRTSTEMYGQTVILHTIQMRKMLRMQETEAKRMAGTSKRGVTEYLRVLRDTYFRKFTIGKVGKTNRTKMGKESERSSKTGDKVFLRESTKRYREKHETLVRNGAGRGQRPDTPTRDNIRTNKCVLLKEALELWKRIYRNVL